MRFLRALWFFFTNWWYWIRYGFRESWGEAKRVLWPPDPKTEEEIAAMVRKHLDDHRRYIMAGEGCPDDAHVAHIRLLDAQADGCL